MFESLEYDLSDRASSRRPTATCAAGAEGCPPGARRLRRRREDVVQDLFLNSGGTRAPSIRSRGSLRAYVLVLARSRSLDRWRSRAAAESARAAGERGPGARRGGDTDLRTLGGERRRRLPRPSPRSAAAGDAILLAYWRGLTASGSPPAAPARGHGEEPHPPRLRAVREPGRGGEAGLAIGSSRPVDRTGVDGGHAAHVGAAARLSRASASRGAIGGTARATWSWYSASPRASSGPSLAAAIAGCGFRSLSTNRRSSPACAALSDLSPHPAQGGAARAEPGHRGRELLACGAAAPVRLL